MDEEQIKQLANSLNLQEGDVAMDAIVIAQVANPEDGEGILLGTTHSVSWVTQLGLLRAAELVVYRLNQQNLMDGEGN